MLLGAQTLGLQRHSNWPAVGAGLSRGGDSAAVMFIHLLHPGNCAVGAAVLPWQWGQCPWAAAGQREVRYEGTGDKDVFALSH